MAESENDRLEREAHELDPRKQLKRLHGAVDRVLPELRKLTGELRTGGQDVRADLLERVTSELSASRPKVRPHV